MRDVGNDRQTRARGQRYASSGRLDGEQAEARRLVGTLLPGRDQQPLHRIAGGHEALAAIELHAVPARGHVGGAQPASFSGAKRPQPCRRLGPQRPQRCLIAGKKGQPWRRRQAPTVYRQAQRARAASRCAQIFIPAA